MQLKVILNRVHKLRSFVYGRIWEGKDSTIQIEVRPRVGSRPCCPGCHKRCPTYDTLRQRRFSFVPLWGLPVVLLYARRRVDRSVSMVLRHLCSEISEPSPLNQAAG